MRNEYDYIYMVYQKGSFSKAAQALYLTQPALSIAIQKIENEIGMPLFDRNQKPLGLTEAGHIYIEKLKQMRALENELNNQLLDLTSMNTGNIQIGATSYMISCILPPVLLRFKKQYPGVNLSIVEAGAYELKEQLRDQRLDVTFISQMDKETLFSSYPAFQDRLILAVPSSLPVNADLQGSAMTSEDIQAKRHLEDTYPSVDLRLFENLPFILLESKYNLRKRTDSFFHEAGTYPRVSMEVTQIVTAYALAQAGIGVTFVPDRAVTKNHRDTIFYKLSYPQTVRNMNIITNKRSYISCAVRHFIDMFTAYYQN